jgi:hypothetical protein
VKRHETLMRKAASHFDAAAVVAPSILPYGGTDSQLAVTAAE